MAKADLKNEEIQNENGEEIGSVDTDKQTVSGGDLDTLRDILFGAQVQATDGRLEDLEIKLMQANKELSTRVEELGNSFREQMMEMQADSRQREDDLRQQLLTLIALLDEQKTSRADLSEMLINMGTELQNSKKSNLVDSGNEPNK